jgi:uncharacterized OB-fold protein
MSDFTIERNEASAPFFDAAREGRLLIRRCTVCGRLYPPQQRRCVDGEPLEWVPATGAATLISWAVDHGAAVAPELLSAAGDGSVIGVVELEEGPWMNAALPGVDPTRLRDGMPMRVEFAVFGEAVPVFLPA